MSRIEKMGGSRLGNFLHFQRDPLDFLSMARGIGDVVALASTQHHSVYIVNAPDFIREILATKDSSFRKGRSSAILGKTLGQGLLTTEGPLHEQQRRMMQPAFHKQKIAEYANAIVENSHDLLESWNSGEERWISQDMMDLTLQIIVQTMFGSELGGMSGVDQAYVSEAVDNVIDFSAKRLMSPVAIPYSLPTKWNMKHKFALRVLNDAVYSFIRQTKDKQQHRRESMLSMLTEYRNETGQPLKDEQIRDQIMTILIAGHETTANALSWTWYLLSQHPDVEAKMWQEIDEVLGDRLPTVEDVSKLHYMQFVLQESLRLYPPAWMILREANEPVELCGENIYANASMIICPYTVHRNPLYFDQADAFLPERFADESMKQVPKYAYFPFGGGSRACIGSNFAMMEATLILATVAQRYQLRLADNHHPIIPEPLVSLRIKDGLKMKVLPR